MNESKLLTEFTVNISQIKSRSYCFARDLNNQDSHCYLYVCVYIYIYFIIFFFTVFICYIAKGNIKQPHSITLLVEVTAWGAVEALAYNIAYSWIEIPSTGLQWAHLPSECGQTLSRLTRRSSVVQYLTTWQREAEETKRAALSSPLRPQHCR